MIGQVEERVLVVWFSHDESEIGDSTLERRALFAFIEEGVAWGVRQKADGFEATWPMPVATPEYEGPTDSTSNAWSVWARRPLIEGEQAGQPLPSMSGRGVGDLPNRALAPLPAATGNLAEERHECLTDSPAGRSVPERPGRHLTCVSDLDDEGTRL